MHISFNGFVLACGIIIERKISCPNVEIQLLCTVIVPSTLCTLACASAGKVSVQLVDAVTNSGGGKSLWSSGPLSKYQWDRKDMYSPPISVDIKGLKTPNTNPVYLVRMIKFVLIGFELADIFSEMAAPPAAKIL